MPDMKSTDPLEAEKEEEQDESEDKPQPAPIKDKKHDSGAADLEKGLFILQLFNLKWNEKCLVEFPNQVSVLIYVLTVSFYSNLCHFCARKKLHKSK